MELFQLLHKNIPQKKIICKYFQQKNNVDLSKFTIQMIKNIKKGTKDYRLLNVFFIEFYDAIYYYLALGKIKIAKKILRLIEELSLPIAYIGQERRKLGFKKILKIKL